MTTPPPNGYRNGASADDAAPLVAVVDDGALRGIASGATIVKTVVVAIPAAGYGITVS